MQTIDTTFQPEILDLNANYKKLPTIELLPVDTIQVDMTYQRTLAPNKVKAMSTKFSKVAAGVLTVSLRENGQFFIIDGQHRLEAMKKCGVMLAECKVIQGLSIKEEAEIYIDCNTVRKNPIALDTFRARLVTNDPIAESIKGVVEKCGLEIQFSYTGGGQGKRMPHSIWAVEAMGAIYRRGKEKLLEDVLSLTVASWPDEGDALKGSTLLGVMIFHLKYQGKYSRDEFIAKMHITEFKSLYRRAQYHAESNGGAIQTAFAKALQEAYDKGKKSRRLEKQ